MRWPKNLGWPGGGWRGGPPFRPLLAKGGAISSGAGSIWAIILRGFAEWPCGWTNVVRDAYKKTIRPVGTGQLLDGLDFCRKVYDLFEEVSRQPDGVARLRLRATKVEKRLIEELIPIACYVQARYSVGRRIKVRWLGGSQPYDGVLWSSGSLVKQRLAPRKLFVEVTTSVHQNDYLARRLLHEQGGCFGVKGISKDNETGRIISKPYVHDVGELAPELAAQIIERLRSKSGKYPTNTVLIVNCVPDSLILPPEWNSAIERVMNAQVHLGFREVFLVELTMPHSATLYGGRKRAALAGRH